MSIKLYSFGAGYLLFTYLMGLPAILKATQGEKSGCRSFGRGITVAISRHIRCTRIRRPDILLRKSCSPVHCKSNIVGFCCVWVVCSAYLQEGSSFVPKQSKRHVGIYGVPQFHPAVFCEEFRSGNGTQRRLDTWSKMGGSFIRKV